MGRDIGYRKNEEGIVSADIELDEVYKIRNKIKMEF